METAPELRRRDLPGVIGAHGRDVRGIEDPRLQERELPVELDPVDLEGVVGDPEIGQPIALEEALIGEIVDRENAGDVLSAPGQIGGARLPCQSLRCSRSGRQSGSPSPGRCRRQPGEARETQIVVRPVDAERVPVRGALPVIEFRAQQYVDREPVAGPGAPEATGRDPERCPQAADPLDRFGPARTGRR